MGAHYSGKSGMQPWMFRDIESHTRVKPAQDVVLALWLAIVFFDPYVSAASLDVDRAVFQMIDRYDRGCEARRGLLHVLVCFRCDGRITWMNSAARLSAFNWASTQASQSLMHRHTRASLT